MYRLILTITSMMLAVASARAEALTLQIERASLGPADEAGMRVLSLELTADSRTAFADFTTRHVGETVELRIDGQLVMSPRLVEPIIGGLVNVQGMFYPGELDAMADRIASDEAEIVVATAGE